MLKNLVARSKFAALCGVSAAAVTQACDSALLAACDGKLVDLNHPLAQNYLASKTGPRPESAATGLDPLYEEAVQFCLQTDRYSASALRKQFAIGSERAKALLQFMGVAGLLPPLEKPSVFTVKDPPRRGKAAAHDRIKAQAWARSRGGSFIPATPPAAGAAADKLDGVFEIPEDIRAFVDMTLRELLERFGTDIRFSDWLGATQKIEGINEKRLKNAETEGRLVSRELVKTAIIDRIDGVFVRMLSDGAKTIASRAHTMALAGADLAEVRGMVEDQLGSFIRPAKAKMAQALRGGEQAPRAEVDDAAA